MEYRKHDRVHLIIPSQIQMVEGCAKEDLIIQDLSIGGVFIASQKLYALDTLIEIRFPLPSENWTISATGFVCRHSCQTPSGMGIQFVILSEGDQKILKKFIRERAEEHWIH